MIFLSILILIVAIALPSINKNISSALYLRIVSIILIYAGALAFNALYIQSIGSGIGIYSDLFHVTLASQLFCNSNFSINNIHLFSICYNIADATKYFFVSSIIGYLLEKGYLGNYIKNKFYFIINHPKTLYLIQLFLELYLLFAITSGMLAYYNFDYLYLEGNNMLPTGSGEDNHIQHKSPDITKDPSNSMSSTSTNNTTINNNYSVNMPNSIKETGLTAIGMKLGMQAGKSLPPQGKLASMVVGGALGLGLSKWSDKTNIGKRKPGEGSNYVMNLIQDSSSSNNNNQLILNEYPFNLLTDLFTFNQLELACLILIFNCFLSTLIKHSNFNYSKYIPNNKFKPKIEYFINRYIDIWYKSNIFVFTTSWIYLIIINFVTKYSLFLILTS
uniref:Uncharacterized protein n=1 Tax=Taiwanofungus camphoratus TaxID=2696576 RepID=A0A4D6SWF3_TAICA|nr:hypothetical protein [Taiwanofungus camphoratus]QCG70023.1 hypothetical protein [Taiwanofungus camphoratus]UKQ56098.1 hypothetical protein [Taiwanofungus camphoratus]WRO45224.1 hypothetical protein [Taiwanofungus sp. YW-2023a]